MSYFDDNELRIISGGGRRKQSRQAREKWTRKQLAAPAGSELAKARIAAHNAFDPLWQSGMFARGVAYEWLASELGLSVAKTHMVLFDIITCRRVVEICMMHPARAKAVAAAFDDLDAI